MALQASPWRYHSSVCPPCPLALPRVPTALPLTGDNAPLCLQPDAWSAGSARSQGLGLSPLPRAPSRQVSSHPCRPPVPFPAAYLSLTPGPSSPPSLFQVMTSSHHVILSSLHQQLQESHADRLCYRSEGILTLFPSNNCIILLKDVCAL